MTLYLIIVKGVNNYIDQDNHPQKTLHWIRRCTHLYCDAEWNSLTDEQIQSNPVVAYIGMCDSHRPYCYYFLTVLINR